MTDHQDWLSGAATDNDVIDGGAGNDLITAGAGDDIIDGGEGVDTANFSGNERDYDISIVDGQLVANDRVAGRDGTDHLTRLEFLQSPMVSSTPTGCSQSGAELRQHAENAGDRWQLRLSATGRWR
jgi:Ca2+-binding RTX toxin-like protein